MVQKALFKQGKKPTVKATAGAGKSFKAKQQAKKTKLGKRYVKAKGALQKDDKLDRAITASIVNNIESETSGAAAQKGTNLKVVVAGPGKALKKQKTRKKESLPAHRTQS